MSRRGYLLLKNRDGSTVTVNLDTMQMGGYKRPGDDRRARRHEQERIERHNQERMERRRRNSEALQADLDAERDASKDGCFGVVLMLLIGAGSIVATALQVMA